jgi:phosphoserine phosphatase
VIVLVRHGETEANRERLALGRADPPLTATGRAQADAVAAALGARLSGVDDVRVVSSPLTRAR